MQLMGHRTSQMDNISVPEVPVCRGTQVCRAQVWLQADQSWSSHQQDIASRIQAASARAGLQRTSDSDTHISALQCRGVIDTVPSHAHQVTLLLQDLHNGVLVLGEHLSKTVSMLHQLINIVHTLQVDDALTCLPASTRSRLSIHCAGHWHDPEQARGPAHAVQS